MHCKAFTLGQPKRTLWEWTRMWYSKWTSHDQYSKFKNKEIRLYGRGNLITLLGSFGQCKHGTPPTTVIFNVRSANNRLLWRNRRMECPLPNSGVTILSLCVLPNAIITWSWRPWRNLEGAKSEHCEFRICHLRGALQEKDCHWACTRID